MSLLKCKKNVLIILFFNSIVIKAWLLYYYNSNLWNTQCILKRCTQPFKSVLQGLVQDTSNSEYFITLWWLYCSETVRSNVKCRFILSCEFCKLNYHRQAYLNAYLLFGQERCPGQPVSVEWPHRGDNPASLWENYEKLAAYNIVFLL